MRVIAALIVLLSVFTIARGVLFSPTCIFDGLPIPNDYYPGVSTNTFQAVIDTSFTSPPIIDSVIMIYQTQNGTIDNSADSPDYGGMYGNGTGYLTSDNAGYYDFNVITGVTLASGNLYTLDLQFALSENFVSNGNAKFQIIVVPYCGVTTITGTPPTFTPWNGEYGGIVALLSHDLIFDTSIDLKGFGFRGGDFSGITTTIGTDPQDDNYADSSAGPGTVARRNAFKGEGFIGTPRLDGNPSTYPSGFDSAHGSPGNAGGGGNYRDSGGGGGSNGGRGGNGNIINVSFIYAGLGAHPAPVSETNLFLGKINYLNSV